MLPSFSSSPTQSITKRRQIITVIFSLSIFVGTFLFLQNFTSSAKNNGNDIAFAPQYTQQSMTVMQHQQQAAAAAFSSYKLNLPLFEAVKSNNIQLVQSLLQGGGQQPQQQQQQQTNYNVNAEDAQGITPIIEASLLGNIEMVELLMLHGATAQPQPGFRHTPLRAACLTANIPLIKLLVDRGADVNAKSEGGRTPLMGACYLRPQFDNMPNRQELSFNTVRLMLQLGANPHITNSFGESALDLCVNRGYMESVNVIKKWWNEKRYARMGQNARL
jgi:ankyrin repeat protein